MVLIAFWLLAWSLEFEHTLVGWKTKDRLYFDLWSVDGVEELLNCCCLFCCSFSEKKPLENERVSWNASWKMLLVGQLVIGKDNEVK